MQNVVVDGVPLRLRRPARLLRLASDERLVVLVREGDEGAFEALYDRHHPAILGFCRHMLGTREEAEDAVQHTFLAAFRDLVASDKPIDLRPWLFAIARNRCLSLLRARRMHVEIEAAEPATDGLAATVERREDLRELLADLACLPEDQRAALLLAELGALDHAGIATVLGCPREKVKALVFQARSSLAASREARATPCEQIRVELATASGAALRRGPLRRHLRACAGCRAFKAEVATQRKLLALALPVVPSMALKASVLGGGGVSTSGGGGAAVGATAGATTSAGNGALGSLLGTAVSTGAGKAAVSVAIAGVLAGGGALTQQLRHAAVASPAAAASTTASERAGSGFAESSPFGFVWRASRHAHPRVTGPTAPREPRLAPPASGSGGTATPTPAQAVAPDPAKAAPSGHDDGVTPGGRPGTPPGQGGTPPGQSGNTPGRGATPPGQGGTPPGQSGNVPGRGTTPPGQGGTPPGQSGNVPGHGTTPPGQGGAPPGQSGSAPGQSGSAPGQSGSTPGHGATPPGQSGNGAGGSGSPHGHSG